MPSHTTGIPRNPSHSSRGPVMTAYTQTGGGIAQSSRPFSEPPAPPGAPPGTIPAEPVQQKRAPPLNNQETFHPRKHLELHNLLPPPPSLDIKPSTTTCNATPLLRSMLPSVLFFLYMRPCLTSTSTATAPVAATVVTMARDSIARRRLPDKVMTNGPGTTTRVRTAVLVPTPPQA